jgi:gliding motility associated protien GldN
MNFRNFSFALVLLMVSVASFAQSNLLNAKTPDQIGKKTAAQDSLDNDKPLPYGYVGDRDVLMGRKVWEMIDLDQRINFPLYYPIEENLGDNRKSLYQVLITGVKAGTITEMYDDSYFTIKKSLKDMQSAFVKIDTTDAGREQFNAGEKISEEYIVKTELVAADVVGYKVVGYWYFDKRQGELKYRMQGICPVVPDIQVTSEEKEYIDLFWIYFPAARDVLHASKAFNEKNSANPITYDHLLNSRRFSSVIYKEENVYGDRLVEEYMKENAQMQLLEAERIKEKIRNFEQDMWNY